MLIQWHLAFVVDWQPISWSERAETLLRAVPESCPVPAQPNSKSQNTEICMTIQRGSTCLGCSAAALSTLQIHHADWFHRFETAEVAVREVAAVGAVLHVYLHISY